MTWPELMAWREGARKQQRLQIDMMGDLIATIINIANSVGNHPTKLTRDDVYPSGTRFVGDYEAKIKEMFGWRGNNQ